MSEDGKLDCLRLAKELIREYYSDGGYHKKKCLFNSETALAVKEEEVTSVNITQLADFATSCLRIVSDNLHDKHIQIGESYIDCFRRFLERSGIPTSTPTPDPHIRRLLTPVVRILVTDEPTEYLSNLEAIEGNPFHLRISLNLHHFQTLPRSIVFLFAQSLIVHEIGHIVLPDNVYEQYFSSTEEISCIPGAEDIEEIRAWMFSYIARGAAREYVQQCPISKALTSLVDFYQNHPDE